MVDYTYKLIKKQVVCQSRFANEYDKPARRKHCPHMDGNCPELNTDYTALF